MYTSQKIKVTSMHTVDNEKKKKTITSKLKNHNIVVKKNPIIS